MSTQDDGTGDNSARAQSEVEIAAMRANFQVHDGKADEQPKKSSKKLLLLVTALLVVAGAAGGAWFFLLQPPAEEPEIVEAPPEVFEKAYIKTDPVHIAFTREDGRRRQLIVMFTLEVEERGSNVIDVHEALPRLQEAFWRSLNATPLPGAEHGAIELTAVKDRILAEADRLLGHDVVYDVLIRDARNVAG